MVEPCEITANGSMFNQVFQVKSGKKESKGRLIKTWLQKVRGAAKKDWKTTYLKEFTQFRKKWRENLK